ncbi:DUF305 domain-containing protein [Methylobacterium sp. E-005]|uniref:DUF305 domain-containing protein n=1 Tax=Methylobacterium sp. E-005 TaxID=2836549 RepID=UPI001FBB33D4|nr:DUF305 domain-containing protein [Methylobacterium sp. E-005]MCJ2085146.1 DUF305 domain-containing protein [Methylobacterium sp. E-005]
MRHLVAAATLLAATTAAWAQHQHHAHDAGPKPAAAQTPATQEFVVAHHKMMAAMDQPYTGDPDADFRIQMIPHHQGAIDMARVALSRAKDPWTGQLAEAIIVEQQREIYDMRGWLARHGYAAPSGGEPVHVIGWNSYRTLPTNDGSLQETQGQSWTPGSGLARQGR